MFYLPQGAQNTDQLLVFHVVDDEGFLVDPTAIGFKILEPDGTQAFPGSGYEDVLTDGRISKGRFWAYDTGLDAAWTVPAAADLGVWKIQWQYTVDSVTSTFTEKFEVVDSTKYDGFGYRTYISPKDAADEGLDEVTLTPARFEFLVQNAQAIVEDMTRNVFRPVYRAVRIDGEHIDRMFLSMPIVGIDEVRHRDSSEVSRSAMAVNFERVDQSHVYRPNPDARRNPTIGLVSSTSIYSSRMASRVSGVFQGGKLNWTIKGVFGFLEADGSVPNLIREAMVRLVAVRMPDIDEMPGAGEQAAADGPIEEVRTYDYQIKYAVSGSSAFQQQSALAKSPLIESILGKYKAPMHIASPSSRIAFGTVRT